MPIRDIVLTATIFGLLPFCLLRPWVGILVWSWIGYMNPHRLTWGFAYTMPFAQIVAVAVFAGMFLFPDKTRQRIPWLRETRLLAALWLIYTVTTLVALYPDEAWPMLEKVSKILLFSFLTLMYFQTRERLRILFLVLALSLGFYGLKGGLWALSSSGVDQVLGPDGTFISGNTEIGLALNMTLPFLLVMAREQPRRWLRYLMRAAFALSIVAVIFTYSRGAVLGLPIVLCMLFLKRGKRLLGLVALAVVAIFVMNFMPQEWFNKMGTISSYEEDRSAMSRIVAWKVAFRLASERPLVGGGFEALPHQGAFGGFERIPSAHSIYFAVLADHGFVALGIFMALIACCFLSLHRLARIGETRPDARWLANYCQMIQASLAGYAVSGAFLTMAYFDLFYHLVTFVILLRVIAQREGMLPQVSPVTAQSSGVRRALVAARPSLRAQGRA